MRADDSRGERVEKFVFLFDSIGCFFDLGDSDLILCGSPHSGKSAAATMMIDILTQMQQQHHLQSTSSTNKLSSSSNDAQEIAAAQTHKLYRYGEERQREKSR